MKKIQIINRNLVTLPCLQSFEAKRVAALEKMGNYLLGQVRTPILLNQLLCENDSIRLLRSALPVALHELWHELSPQAMIHPDYPRPSAHSRRI